MPAVILVSCTKGHGGVIPASHSTRVYSAFTNLPLAHLFTLGGQNVDDAYICSPAFTSWSRSFCQAAWTLLLLSRNIKDAIRMVSTKGIFNSIESENALSLSQEF